MMVRAIKILMPQELRTFESGLRLVGYGPQVDEFIRAVGHGRVGLCSLTGARGADLENGALTGGMARTILLMPQEVQGRTGNRGS